MDRTLAVKMLLNRNFSSEQKAKDIKEYLNACCLHKAEMWADSLLLFYYFSTEMKLTFDLHECPWAEAIVTTHIH